MEGLEELRCGIDEVDSQMAALFVRRMELCRKVALYKMERGLPVLDSSREKEVLDRGGRRVEDPVLKVLYADFQKSLMAVSRSYQGEVMKEETQR